MIELQLFEQGSEDVICTHAQPETAEFLAASLKVTIIAVKCDWGTDLTPWKAQDVFDRKREYAGKADEHLRELICKLREITQRPCGMVGYSLDGLFSAYAATRTNYFTRIASVSGSLWYPGWRDYVSRTVPNVCRAYFSVGDREKQGRNKVFHSIEEDTCYTKDYFASQGIDTIFELNQGGHFEEPEQRMKNAIQWLRRI